MASVEENILTAIKAKGRGSIFFPSDFTSYGEVKAVGKSLERLTAKGDIIRLARGIYTYPEIDTVLEFLLFQFIKIRIEYKLLHFIFFFFNYFFYFCI